MSENIQPKPQQSHHDAVIGGDSPAPTQAAVLGGLGQVQNRLISDDLETKFAAMQDCLNYGEVGVAEVIPFLEDPLPRTQWEAYQLLRSRPEKFVQTVLKDYRFWQHFEKLDGYPVQHIQMFANRQAINFEALMGHENMRSIALGFRENKGSAWERREEEKVEKKLIDFLTLYDGDLVEAIILGYGIYGPQGRDLLIRERSSFSNVKAIFLGDIEDREQMISDIQQSDLSPLLSTYPKLEILHVRGDATFWQQKLVNKDGLRFSQIDHQNLTTLIIETGGLSRKAIDDLCNLSLPSLEYLELWMGSADYGSDSTVENLTPILSGTIFPRLKYLGLRNCEYTDDIAIALAQAPRRSSLIELDLSMGNLTDTGAEALINSGIMDSLNTLNISHSYLSRGFLPRVAEFSCSVISNNQRYGGEKIPARLRCCFVRE